MIFKIGMAGRDQVDRIKIILVPGLLCNDQMTVMDRIKGASEHADPFSLPSFRIHLHLSVKCVTV